MKKQLNEDEMIDHVDADQQEIDSLANNLEKLESSVRSLSEREFERLIDEIFADNSLSEREKTFAVQDLHRIARKTPTYKTIGKMLGISKQAVYKIEQRAMKKMRKLMKKAGLTVGAFEED